VPDLSCQQGLYCACLNELCPGFYEVHNPDDVCAEQLDDGEDCENGYECLGGYCVSNECAGEAPVTPNCSR
jgi:hypothetical protein